MLVQILFLVAMFVSVLFGAEGHRRNKEGGISAFLLMFLLFFGVSTIAVTIVDENVEPVVSKVSTQELTAMGEGGSVYITPGAVGSGTGYMYFVKNADGSVSQKTRLTDELKIVESDEPRVEVTKYLSPEWIYPFEWMRDSNSNPDTYVAYVPEGGISSNSIVIEPEEEE